MTEKLKNQAEWKPTKIKRRSGKFRVNPFKIGPGSYYITLEAFRVLNTCRPYLQGRLVDLGCGNAPYFEWFMYNGMARSIRSSYASLIYN